MASRLLRPLIVAAMLLTAMHAEGNTLDLRIEGVDDEAPIVTAIMDELDGAPLGDEPARLDVIIDTSQVHMRYAAGDREPLSRVVARPKSDKELPEVVALLAGNLARDQAGPLIEDLGKAERAPNPNSDVVDDATELLPVHDDAADEADDEEDVLPFQLALASPVAIVPSGKEHTFAFDLGILYSHSGGLRGFGLNALVRRVEGDVRGFDMAGVYAHRGGSLVGFAAAGGVITSAGPFSKGFEASGIASIAADTTFTGLQTSGIVNVSGPFGGVQIAGVTNISDGVNGMQLSIANVSKETVEGVQLGLFNYAARLEGVQIGLINIASAGGLPFCPFLNVGW